MMGLLMDRVVLLIHLLRPIRMSKSFIAVTKAPFLREGLLLNVAWETISFALMPMTSFEKMRWSELAPA